ncbi:glycosyltransferase family 4 protein [Crocosphaera sp. XPORK-15E]|uniref:glycosyltransferase family 4 protein n=1 Tax=Crocosphaera sp. XPORK-15E TaxID=3110247 RepID=UPI002B220227|nr:glycosyltransferase family 4 protein [Crocosphaera sp. XPORK-15E]MEA5536722.1 glycosyltransferase family 4 protein [Crocosphaera sp. XPORK-15E]
MKIAFFDYIWTLAEPPKFGSGILCYQLALRLARSNNVIFYGSKAPDHQELEYTQDGITYHRISTNLIDKILGWLRVLDDWNFFSRKRPFYASRLCDFRYYWQIGKDLQSQNCDVIQINFTFHVAPLIRALNPQAKIVVFLQTEWLTQLDHQMVAKQLEAVDLIIGCSNYITNKIRNQFPTIPCETVFNGVDINHFKVNPEVKNTQKEGIVTLLFVGRVSPEKGIHILLQAFNQVILKYPQVQLKIVGPEDQYGVLPVQMLDTEDPYVENLIPFYQGKYSQQLRQIISAHAASSVSFVGPIKQLDLVEHYQKADIFVFPSVWNEPFGIPLVEAMAMELPIIATHSGAFPEIVEDEKTGLLVERANPDALATAILQLLEDKNLRDVMGKAARKQAVNKFSWEKINENLLIKYQNLFGSDKYVVKTKIS